MIEMIITLIIIEVIGKSGTIPNHQLNAVNPMMNNAVTINASSSLNTDTCNFVCSLFLAFANVNNNKIPQIPVAITQRLEYCSSAINPILFKKAITNIFSSTVNPVGRARIITFRKNFPSILSLFGSNAKINDGSPIVILLIRLICIGSNGYCSCIIKNITASNPEYIVFTRNSVAERCILFIVLLPFCYYFWHR